MSVSSNVKPTLNCYVCNTTVPYDSETDSFNCSCGKVWRRKVLEPTPEEGQCIPGAKNVSGGKSVKKKGGKDKLNRPTQKVLYDRLYGQT